MQLIDHNAHLITTYRALQGCDYQVCEAILDSTWLEPLCHADRRLSAESLGWDLYEAGVDILPAIGFVPVFLQRDLEDGWNEAEAEAELRHEVEDARIGQYAERMGLEAGPVSPLVAALMQA